MSPRASRGAGSGLSSAGAAGTLASALERRRDLALALSLGGVAFLLFRATEQPFLFHDAVFYRGLLEDGAWRYAHLLWLPVLQLVRATFEAIGDEVPARQVLHLVSAGSGAVLVAASFGLARTVVPRGPATLLGLLALSTPAIWFQSASACIHAFHGAFATLAFFAILRLRPSSRFATRFAAGAAAALAPLSHTAGLLLLPGVLAFAWLRGGRLDRRPLERTLPFVVPLLAGTLGTALRTWRSGPGFPLRAYGNLIPATFQDFGFLAREAFLQLARHMPALGACAILGWALTPRRYRGLVLSSIVTAAPVCLGVLFSHVDLRGAYYLGITGVLVLGAALLWRILAARVGPRLASPALAAVVVLQAVSSVPDRIREADPRPLDERARLPLQGDALLLYEPDPREVSLFQDRAGNRLVLNLWLLDVLPPEAEAWGLAELRRLTVPFDGKVLFLDRRLYDAAATGSRIAPWLAEFRARYEAEPLPENPLFERLRPIALPADGGVAVPPGR